MSSISSIKEAITKVKAAMNGEEPEKKKESMSMKNMKEAQKSLKEAQSKLKIAEDEGSMSPDEAKQMAEEIQQLGAQVVDAAMTIAEQVPSSEGGMGEGSSMGEEGGMGHENPMEKKENPMASGMGEEKEKEDPEVKMAQMQKVIDGMQRRDAQIKLSQKYSILYPPAMRQAKEEEFMKREAPMAVLQAQVEEAQSILSGREQMALHVAQKADKPFDISDEKEHVEVGGKC